MAISATDRLHVVLFDTVASHLNLLPLAFTRPVADFRVGMITLRQKWEAVVSGSYSYITVDYLQEKFNYDDAASADALFVAGNLICDDVSVGAVNALKPGQALAYEDDIVALRGSRAQFDAVLRSRGLIPGDADEAVVSTVEVLEYKGEDPLRRIVYLFDIFLENGQEIESDYRRIVPKDAPVAQVDKSVTIIGPERTPDGYPSLYIEQGASVEGCIINVKGGPVYIGRDAAVMEASAIRGPLALCDNSKIKMGAKVYGATTIGPWCKIGGEIDNAVIFGYSNKAHDGYLGNSVIGEWCNIGAGTNASNLKNDYSKIRIWNYRTHTFMRTDLQFCGLMMGDHSKAGINCMFNTASVVGVGVNLHGSGFPRVFLPSFSTGSPEGGFTDVVLGKFMTTAATVMSRRGLTMHEQDRHIFEHIYATARQFK